MELEISKTDLVRVLSIVQNVVERRNTMPILVNVLITASDDHVKVAATDLEVTTSVQASANVIKPGSTTVNAKVLYDIVRELPDQNVKIKLSDGERIEITAGKSIARILGVSAEEYPTLPGFGLKATNKISARQLSEMVSKTLYAVSQDETRFNLSGVCFSAVSDTENTNSLRMVATDGHRLAMITRDVPGLTFEGTALVPRKGLAELKKLLDSALDAEVSIDILKGFMVVEIDQGSSGLAKFAMRLIDGEFPDYRQVVPKNKGTLAKVNSGELAKALRRVSLLVSDKEKGIRLDFTEGLLKISSSSPELGDAYDDLEAEYSGEPISVGANAKYIQDITSSLSEEQTLVIELNGQLGPLKFYAENDESYIAIVMPMRL